MSRIVWCGVIATLLLTACGTSKASEPVAESKPIGRDTCEVVGDDEVRLVLALPNAAISPDVVQGADGSVVCSWTVDPNNAEVSSSGPALPPAFVRVSLNRSQTVSATYSRVELASTGAVRVPNLGDKAIATVSTYGTQINALLGDTYVVGLAIRNDTNDSLPAEPLAALLRRVFERLQALP